MSHSKHRKENDCLNCGAVVHGNYCHVCGQENIETKESFWGLLTHFIYDITHFDGKFFTTIKYLLFKPGFLSHEYLKGRRNSYLHPIRMYVFTSAFFFLIIFSFYKDIGMVNFDTPTNAVEIIQDLKKEKELTEKKLLKPNISISGKEKLKRKIMLLDSDINVLLKDTTKKDNLVSDDKKNFQFSNSTDNYDYKSIREYDSIQATLSKEKRNNYLERFFEKINIRKTEKYGDDDKKYIEVLQDNFIHHFPQVLFTSLPFFALLLKLLYRRQRKIFYINHVIFTIHLYCAIFIIILLRLWTGSIFNWFHASMPGLLKFIFFIGALFYLYKSLRNFYEQRRAKTILKFSLLTILTFFLLAIISLIFLIFTISTI